jgi:hypothetical protein
VGPVFPARLLYLLFEAFFIILQVFHNQNSSD